MQDGTSTRAASTRASGAASGELSWQKSSTGSVLVKSWSLCKKSGGWFPALLVVACCPPSHRGACVGGGWGRPPIAIIFAVLFFSLLHDSLFFFHRPDRLCSITDTQQTTMLRQTTLQAVRRLGVQGNNRPEPPVFADCGAKHPKQASMSLAHSPPRPWPQVSKRTRSSRVPASDAPSRLT